MQRQYLLLLAFIGISGCTAAFEVGESLNRATSNIANDPKVLWSPAEPASAPAASSSPDANVAPKEEAK